MVRALCLAPDLAVSQVSRSIALRMARRSCREFSTWSREASECLRPDITPEQGQSVRSVAWTTQQSPCPHNAIFSELRWPSGPLYLIMHADSIRPIDSVGTRTEVFFYLHTYFAAASPACLNLLQLVPRLRKMYLHAPTQACTKYYQHSGTWAEFKSFRAQL